MGKITVDLKLNLRVYRHYKGGHYLYLGEGIHSETQEELVFL